MGAILRLLIPLIIAIVTFVVALVTHAATIPIVEQTQAQAAPEQHIFSGLEIGDLVKLADDGDPATTTDTTVYYFDRDWKRRPFPNKSVFDSWYADFSTVKEVTAEQLAAMRLGPPVVYRPGTRLVKIPSIPKVYAVEPGGTLRWIVSEEVAIAIYGADWNKRVDDVSETFFLGYAEGAPLRSGLYPTGSVLRRSDGAMYLVEGTQLRRIPADQKAVLRIQDRFMLSTPTLPSAYELGGDASDEAGKLTDTAQLSRVETLSPPQIDFPAPATNVAVGADKTIMTMRLTVGQSVSIKRMSFHLAGAATLTNMRVVNAATGESLFGTLVDPGALPTTVTFTGAATFADNTDVALELRADVAAGSGPFTVRLDHETASLVDGFNSSNAMPLWPRAAYPTFSVAVE